MSKDNNNNNDNDDNGFLPNFGDGDSDPKKYEKYIRKIYKDITGEDLPSGDLEFTSLDDLGEKQEFIQSLIDDESQESFDNYVESNDMELSVNLTYMGTNLIVEEIWTPTDGSAIVTRVHNYDDILTSKINPYIQKEIYTKRLEMLIEEEEYEKAAKVRDILNNL